MMGVYRQEVWLLRRLLRKMKKQHGSFWMYKKMQHLSRLLDRDKVLAVQCCEDLYILGSSNLSLGHFVSLTVVVMGICARLRFLLGRMDIQSQDEIDHIFSEVQ